MRPLEHPSVDGRLSSTSDGLVWPAPVTDSDILWLEPEPEPAALPVAVSHESPASPSRISIAQLLATGAAIEWHDAVAIVSQLANHVVPDRKRPPSSALPPIDAIYLDVEGRVDASLDRRGSESLAAGFGRVLQALLQDKPTPANLRLLAWRATSESGTSMTLDEIVAELARWERPGRDSKLKDLYARALAAGPLPAAVPQPPPVEVVRPVAEPPRIVDAAPAPVAAPVPAPSAASRALSVLRSKQPLALVAAGALMCMTAGGAAVWLLVRPSSEPPPATTVESDAPPVTSPADIDLPPMDRPVVTSKSRRGTPSSRASVPRATRGAESPRNRDRALQATPNIPSTQIASLSSPATPRLVRPAPEIGGVPSSLIAPQALPPPPPDMHVYRSGDAGIVEPILVKPYLPLRPNPDIPDSALGVLEVVVDARGQVESVHLRSPANRYREKWWLFTAKEWRFEPAKKNGTPVRFLKRILLTDLNILEPQ